MQTFHLVGISITPKVSCIDPRFLLRYAQRGPTLISKQPLSITTHAIPHHEPKGKTDPFPYLPYRLLNSLI